MRRSWLGFGLLAVLLVIALLVSGMMPRIHREIELDLYQASLCALDGDWDGARLFLGRASRLWRRWDVFRSCFSDHGPTEQIDASFAALEVCREKLLFSAGCRSLARQIAAVGEAHALNWRNFL